MSMFDYFVVVSLSAAIAGSNTPAFALNQAETSVSPPVPTFNQLQRHVPSSEPLPTVSGQTLEDVAKAAISSKSLTKSSPGNLPRNPISKQPSAFGASSSQRVAQKLQLTQAPSVNTLPERIPQVPLPDYLEANPNPLQFPTRPQEVQIDITQPLTLQQALELVQRNNRDIQVARLQLERNRSAVREAQADLFPTLSLQVDLAGAQSTSSQLSRDSLSNQIDQLQQQIDQQQNSTLSAQLQSQLTQLQDQRDRVDQANGAFSSTLAFEYNIFTGGRVSAQIRAAQEQERISRLQVESLTAQTLLDVADAYYDLQAADEAVRIYESSVRNAIRTLQDAQALEQAGLGTQFDILQAQVNLAQANQNLVTARAQQQANRRKLAQLLSLPQNINVVAADPVEVAGLWDLTMEQSIVLAFQNRAELQRYLAEANYSRQQKRIALSTYIPQVSVFFNYNLLDNWNDGFGLVDGYSVGARMQWNIFDGGAGRARAAQQQANIAIAQTQFASQRNQIRFNVEQSYFNLRANLENIQTASVALEQATESLRLARLRFQAGVGTQTDVIDAENRLTEAQGNRATAIIDYNRSLASLQRAISNLPYSALTTPLPVPSPGGTTP